MSKPRVITSVSIKPELLAIAKEQAKELKVSLSRYIELLIVKGI